MRRPSPAGSCRAPPRRRCGSASPTSCTSWCNLHRRFPMILMAIGCALLSRSQEMFVRLCRPVAEEAGVRLAAHPDDPPLPVLRGVSKLICKRKHITDSHLVFPPVSVTSLRTDHPDRYQKMLDICECGVCLSRRYLSGFPERRFEPKLCWHQIPRISTAASFAKGPCPRCWMAATSCTMRSDDTPPTTSPTSTSAMSWGRPQT